MRPLPICARSLIARLALVWGTPDLESRVHLRTSRRMTRTLARAFPSTGEVRISTRVLEFAPEDLLLEIVCHEAAHVACFLIHGRRVRPHGAEWRRLMRRAGYAPRVRLNTDAIPSFPQPSRRPRVYQHHCPACGWTGLARTTNRRWRCAACVTAGRSGRLVVGRVGPAG
jgi:predicted SprT family Zn-dependent metalloprotease